MKFYGIDYRLYCRWFIKNMDYSILIIYMCFKRYTREIYRPNYCNDYSAYVYGKYTYKQRISVLYIKVLQFSKTYLRFAHDPWDNLKRKS